MAGARNCVVAACEKLQLDPVEILKVQRNESITKELPYDSLATASHEKRRMRSQTVLSRDIKQSKPIMPSDWEEYVTQCLVAKKATFADEETVRAESMFHYNKDVIDNNR